MAFDPRRPFGQYREGMLANVLAFTELVALIYLCLWYTTSGSADSLVVSIASFYWRLLIIPAVIVAVDTVYKVMSPTKHIKNQFPVSLGFGSGWRAGLAVIGAIMTFLVLRFAGNLSFMSTNLSISNTPTTFWFIVVIGVRAEESFRNILTPTLIAGVEIIVKQLRRVTKQQETSLNIMAGLFVIFFVMSPLFAVFHWYTYMEQGAGGGGVALLLFGAYIYSIIFTMGMYFFQSDEYSKTLHMLHNFAVFVAVVGAPALPPWQLAAVVALLFALTVYFISVFLVNFRRIQSGRGIKLNL